MNYHKVFESEVKANVYAGDNCDEVSLYFESHTDVDEETDIHTDDIIIHLSDHPAGTKITIEHPCCPKCDKPREDVIELQDGMWKFVGYEPKCKCGFDWEQWIQEHYC